MWAVYDAVLLNRSGQYCKVSNMYMPPKIIRKSELLETIKIEIFKTWGHLLS